MQSVEHKVLDELDDDPNDDFEPHDAKLAFSALVLVLVLNLMTAILCATEQISFVDAFITAFLMLTTGTQTAPMLLYTFLLH